MDDALEKAAIMAAEIGTQAHLIDGEAAQIVRLAALGPVTGAALGIKINRRMIEMQARRIVEALGWTLAEPGQVAARAAPKTSAEHREEAKRLLGITLNVAAPSQNVFSVGVNHSNHSLWEDLVKDGIAEKTKMIAGMTEFRLTPYGLTWALEIQTPEPLEVVKAARVILDSMENQTQDPARWAAAWDKLRGGAKFNEADRYYHRLEAFLRELADDSHE